jgi:hypothetical protein
MLTFAPVEEDENRHQLIVNHRVPDDLLFALFETACLVQTESSLVRSLVCKGFYHK